MDEIIDSRHEPGDCQQANLCPASELAHNIPYAEASRRKFLGRQRRWIWLKGTASAAIVALITFEVRFAWPLNIFGLTCLVLSACMTWSALARTKFHSSSVELSHAPIETADEDPDYQLTDGDQSVHLAVRNAVQTLSRSYRLWQWSLIGARAGPLICGILIVLIGPHLSLFCIAATAIIGGRAMRYFRVRGDKAAEQVVAGIQQAGPELVGAVIDFIGSTEATNHPIAYEALTKLVSRVRPAHEAAIHSVHRSFLYRLLEPDPPSNRYHLVLAILTMIRRLSDPSAEPYIHRLLLDADPVKHRVLFDEANLALQAIGMADAALGPRRGLLSPACANDMDMLLKPSVQSSDDHPDELLRTVNE